MRSHPRERAKVANSRVLIAHLYDGTGLWAVCPFALALDAAMSTSNAKLLARLKRLGKPQSRKARQRASGKVNLYGL